MSIEVLSVVTMVGKKGRKFVFCTNNQNDIHREAREHATRLKMCGYQVQCRHWRFVGAGKWPFEHVVPKECNANGR